MTRRSSSVPALALAFVGALAACSSRAVPDDDMGDDDPTMGPPPGELQPGDQPSAPGSMFSPCMQSSECAPLELCVFPQGESGFCTGACTAPDDPSACDPPPGDQPSTCLDIGLADGRWVCALDCADAPCPTGMRCEQVAAGGGERSICF